MHIKDIPSVLSLEDLHRVAHSLERETLRRYTQLAELMKYGHNPETADVFEALAARELLFGDGESVATLSHENLGHDTNKPGAEIADTPYLMTPHLALSMAVYNEEQAFDLFSRIAAETEDPAIREQAESLARNQIQYIAEFRLQRRRALHDQTKTAVGRIGHDCAPKSLDELHGIQREIGAIIRDVIEKEFHDLKAKLSEHTTAVLNHLVQETGMPDEGERVEQLSPAKAGEDDPQQVFWALRTLLRETEAAFEMFMAFAETSASEDMVIAAQGLAQKYVRLLPLIRNEMDVLVDT